MTTKCYFRIDLDHPIAIEHNNYMEKREKAILAARDYVHKELGADQNRIYDNAKIHSVIFEDSSKVPIGLKNKKGRPSNEFYPDERTKIGKEIANKFDSFKIERDRSSAMIDHPEFFGSMGSGMCMHTSVVWRSDKDNVFAIIPVNEENTFTKPDGFTEILPSEFNKFYGG